MSEEQFIGRHSYRIEGTWVHWKPRGAVVLSDAQTVTSLYQEMITRNGRMLLTVDLTELNKAMPEARKHFVSWLKSTGNGSRMAIAPFGANLIAAAIVTLLASAARRLGGYAPRVKICSDYAAARTWLTEQERLLSSSPQSRSRTGR